MKKQYVVTFRNTNPRLNQTLRYLTKVTERYPYRSAAIEDAMVFNTKADARHEICRIDKNNLYHKEVSVVAVTIAR